MTMTKCKGCGKEYRKGARVLLLINGGIQGARVCQTCASRGATLVAAHAVPVVKYVIDARTDAVIRILRQLRILSKLAGAAIKEAGNDHEMMAHAQGREEGFDGAIEVINESIIERIGTPLSTGLAWDTAVVITVRDENLTPTQASTTVEKLP
jgi:hypothetical protein